MITWKELENQPLLITVEIWRQLKTSAVATFILHWCYIHGQNINVHSWVEKGVFYYLDSVVEIHSLAVPYNSVSLP